jgi:maleylacetoacetate isomerase
MHSSDLSLASSSPVVSRHCGQTLLYSYWRSSCSWRVRIALHFKGIPFEYCAVNLLKDEQKASDYTTMHPGALVPTLVIDNVVLTQSIAILEYLEERRPESWRLLPQDALKRAQVRSIVQLISSDIQPVQNLRVLKYVGDEKKTEWARHWISVGLMAVEQLLTQTSGAFCVGDEVSLADVCLVPQIYNARR